MDTPSPTFWVLERSVNGSPRYWDGGHAESQTANIGDALQFARKQDAFWATRDRGQYGWRIVEHAWMPTDNPSVQQLVEAYLADEFYRETGLMAPGKSVPLEMASVDNDAERQQRYVEWERVRRAARRQMLRDVLAALSTASRSQERAERVFQAVVYAYEGKDVPEDLRDHGFVRRGQKHYASRSQEPEHTKT